MTWVTSLFRMVWIYGSVDDDDHCSEGWGTLATGVTSLRVAPEIRLTFAKLFRWSTGLYGNH